MGSPLLPSSTVGVPRPEQREAILSKERRPVSWTVELGAGLQGQERAHQSRDPRSTEGRHQPPGRALALAAGKRRPPPPRERAPPQRPLLVARHRHEGCHQPRAERRGRGDACHWTRTKQGWNRGGEKNSKKKPKDERQEARSRESFDRIEERKRGQEANEERFLTRRDAILGGRRRGDGREVKGYGRGEEGRKRMRGSIELKRRGASFGESAGRWREPLPTAKRARGRERWWQLLETK